MTFSPVVNFAQQSLGDPRTLDVDFLDHQDISDEGSSFIFALPKVFIELLKHGHFLEKLQSLAYFDNLKQRQDSEFLSDPLLLLLVILNFTHVPNNFLPFPKRLKLFPKRFLDLFKIVMDLYKKRHKSPVLLHRTHENEDHDEAVSHALKRSKAGRAFTDLGFTFEPGLNERHPDTKEIQSASVYFASKDIVKRTKRYGNTGCGVFKGGIQT